MVPYATPGTDDLASQLGDAMATANAFLLEKHGAITIGTDMAEAFYRMETIEFMAELMYRVQNGFESGTWGLLRPLPKDEVERILKGK